MIGGNESGQGTPINDRMKSFINKNNFHRRINKVFSPKITRDDKSYLHRIKDLYEEELGPTLMKEFHDELLGRSGKDVYVTGREEMIQPLVNWLMEELISHKGKFQYIFRTSRGSTYFVLPTGESLRFKMADSNIRQGLFGPIRRDKPLTSPYLTIEQVADRCYFIDETEQKRILGEQKGGFLDINVQTTNFGEGMIPLEVQSAYQHGKGNLPIGTDSSGVLHIGDNVRYYHPGSQVTEVIYRK